MELLDIYNNNGERTGKTITRGDKSIILSDDEHIAVAVIFIENSKNEFLIQKTSIEKGGKYSSTGGHICSGETPIESIKREVKEELGITIDSDDIKELGYLLYDKPLRYMFYLRKDIDTATIQIQEDEVESVRYMTVQEIKNIIEQDNFTKSHAIIFEKVLEYIREK